MHYISLRLNNILHTSSGDIQSDVPYSTCGTVIDKTMDVGGFINIHEAFLLENHTC